MNRIRYWWPVQCAAALVLTLACMEPAALAASVQTVPDKIPYQGRITGFAKDIIVIPDPEFQFRLYDGKDGGANLLWSEQHPTSVFKNGVYSVVLGDGNAIAPEPHPSLKSVVTTKDLWLAVSTTNENPAYAVRQRFTAVPYALTADTAVRAKNGVPVGTIAAWAGKTAPEGWLLCDGNPYDTKDAQGKDTQYTALAAVIGTTWGGSGNTFNVPKLGGRMLVGAGSGQTRNTGSTTDIIITSHTLGTRFGHTQEALTSAQIPSHIHTYTDKYPLLDIVNAAYSIKGGGHYSSCKNDGQDAVMDSAGSAADTASHSTLQPSTVVAFIIKY